MSDNVDSRTQRDTEARRVYGLPMHSALTPASPASLPARLADELARAAAYAEAARSPATRRAYAADWRRFAAWCAARGLASLPASPAAVATFLAAEADAGRAPATIGRRLAAIGHQHRIHGHPPPQARPGAAAIAEVLAGIRRARGLAASRKRAIEADLLHDMLTALPQTSRNQGLRAKRDRAMLALGMAAALRRSELAALSVEDVCFVPEGLRLAIRRSKTDQEGRGTEIAVPEGRRLRAVAHLRAWLAASGLTSGPLFRRLTRKDQITEDPVSDRAVARLVQQAAAAAGQDPRAFGGHSLRAGFLTEAAANGASLFKMQEVSRHRSVDVLARYVRTRDAFRNHAGEGFL